MHKTKAQINKRKKERKKYRTNKISIKIDHTKTGSSLQGVFAASEVDVAGGSTQGEGGLGALAHDLHAVGVAEGRGCGAASTILLVVGDVVLRVLAVVGGRSSSGPGDSVGGGGHSSSGPGGEASASSGGWEGASGGGVVPLDLLHGAYALHEHGHFLLVGGAELLEGWGSGRSGRIPAVALAQDKWRTCP